MSGRTANTTTLSKPFQEPERGCPLSIFLPSAARKSASVAQVVAMIDFYGFDTANSLKVLIFLEETGAAYAFHPVNIRAGEQKAASFLTINPRAKVPVIVDHAARGGSLTVTESAAILIYLAEKSGLFLPADEPERSTALQWLMFQAASCGPIFGQAEYWQHLAPGDNASAIAHYSNLANGLIDQLEQRLSKSRFFAGGAYTVADMAHFGWLWRREYAGVDFTGRTNLQRWYREIEQRSAVSRALLILQGLTPTG